MSQAIKAPMLTGSRHGNLPVLLPEPVHPGSPTDVLALLAVVTELQRKVSDLTTQRNDLCSALQTIDGELQRAAEVQRDLLPAPTDSPRWHIHSLYRPLERVSGDIYDHHRLDATHLAVSVADASGHGLPAGMMTSQLKQALRGDGNRAAAFDPGTVLARANRAWANARFTNCMFAAGLYAVLDEATHRVSFARAGLPYPIHVRPGQTARQLAGGGPVLGAVDDAVFTTQTVDLVPGDALVFLTDGVEALLVEGAAGGGTELPSADWYRRLPDRPIAESLDDLDLQHSSLRRTDWPADDLTVLAVVAH